MKHHVRDRYDKHGPSSKHRRLSRSRSPNPSQELHIQMKPLVLASNDESNRQNEINYIEGSSFTQKSFVSTRKQLQTVSPNSLTLSDPNLNIHGSQYGSIVSERAHEAAIFGYSTTPLPSTILGTDPSESKERLISSLDTIKQLLHPRLKKSDPQVWHDWVVKLSSFKEKYTKSKNLVT